MQQKQRELHRYEYLPQETRKISNKQTFQLNDHKKNQVKKKINKTKSWFFEKKQN